MGGVEGGDKKPLPLDWAALLPDSDDQMPELIVTSREDQSPVECSASVDSSDQSAFMEIESLTDQKLEESIASKSRTLQTVGSKLSDGGAKLRDMLNRLLEERNRRKLHQNGKDVNECVRITPSRNPDLNGASDGSREETTSSQKQSSFTRLFSKSLDESSARRIADVDKAPFGLKDGERCRKKFKRKLSSIGRRKTSPSTRRGSLDRTGDADQRGRACSPSTPFASGPFSQHLAERKDDFHVLPFNNSKRNKGHTVVLDDEEECHLTETAEQACEIPKCMNETKIYYPSRDDPGSVEICSTEIDCLKPEGYLTSPIMNFYILFLQLQASLSSRGIGDYLFFNTYFYKKLQEAVSCKDNVKDVSFAKFRRWWKGVNIFQKAYIFIPIHEDLHWSLAIICIPDKEDGSGPILLHLDSLHFHQSKPIFDNIRRFLVEEWNYMKQNDSPLDPLIADEVWEVLPRQISDKKIMVPQQKNDYDCGLFVLYFMERFIEEAPARLKKKDLAMFGKRWFRPEEASSLRLKIRNLLLKELEKATAGDRDTPDSSPRSESDPSECPETIE